METICIINSLGFSSVVELQPPNPNRLGLHLQDFSEEKKVSVLDTSTFSSLLVFISKVIFLLEILKYVHLCSELVTYALVSCSSRIACPTLLGWGSHD